MTLSNAFLEIEPFAIDDGLEIGIIIFSAILFALSITAYRNTGIKKILFAAAAFALFAIQMLVDTIGDYVGSLEGIMDILAVLITFAILVLFFVAIVKKR